MSRTIDIFTSDTPVRSYAEANRVLVESFARYLQSRAFSPRTIRSYRDSCNRFIESMGSHGVASANRTDVRILLAGLLKKGLAENSVRLHTAALRNFYKFIRLSGLTTNDPTFGMSNRQLPRRLPRVLTVAEVEALINAAQNPFEKAVAEVLYSTGARVSELVNLRVENVDFDNEKILLKVGKGGRGRYLCVSSYAAKAIQDYWAWRHPEAGFVFERKRWNGYIRIEGPSWFGTFPVRGKYRQVCLGPTERLKTKDDARRALDRLLAATPGYKPIPAGPYTPMAIRNVLHRLAWRAAIGRVHPHSLRRAFACHMLSHGADVRSIQEFLGHTNLSTTMLYTHLTPDELKAVHKRCHPHEQGGRDDKDA